MMQEERMSAVQLMAVFRDAGLVGVAHAIVGGKPVPSTFAVLIMSLLFLKESDLLRLPLHTNLNEG